MVVYNGTSPSWDKSRCRFSENAQQTHRSAADAHGTEGFSPLLPPLGSLISP